MHGRAHGRIATHGPSRTHTWTVNGAPTHTQPRSDTATCMKQCRQRNTAGRAGGGVGRWHWEVNSSTEIRTIHKHLLPNKVFTHTHGVVLFVIVVPYIFREATLATASAASADRAPRRRHSHLPALCTYVLPRKTVCRFWPTVLRYSVARWYNVCDCRLSWLFRTNKLRSRRSLLTAVAQHEQTLKLQHSLCTLSSLYLRSRSSKVTSCKRGRCCG